MQSVEFGRAVRSTANHDWLHKLARVGFATKGVVYFLIGALALEAALSGGKPKGEPAAVQHIRDLPFGVGLLVLTGIGLVGYALWRAIEALFDPDHEGTGALGIVKRLGHFGAAILHGGLAVAAFELALGHAGSHPDETRTWIGKIMVQPFGPTLVLIVGLVVAFFGGAQIVSAITGEFTRYLDHLKMNENQRCWVTRLGRLGLGARGVVFCTVGVFIVRAGLHSNPNEATGMPGALSHLQSASYGTYVLAVVAVGLVCYGLFMVACSRFRHLGRV